MASFSISPSPSTPSLDPSTDNHKDLVDDSDESSSSESDRLSAALALFLSNPSLKSGLADGSLDLTGYKSVVEEELAVLERECVEAYRSKASEMEELRSEMASCDGVLASLQEMLLGFQADLGGLSGDIRSLQEQSRDLGVRLRNRREAEKGLRGFLTRVVVPPNLAHAVCHGAVDDVFLDCVKELERKYAFLTRDEEHVVAQDDSISEHDHENDIVRDAPSKTTTTTTTHRVLPKQTVAGREMIVHVEKLRARAAARTREYFLSVMAGLRKPRTNVRMIQINKLLRYASLNREFLYTAEHDVYEDVARVYADSMSRTLVALFRTYLAQLARLERPAATRADVIAGELADSKRRQNAFVLGDRADEVLDTDDPPVQAHVAMAEGLTFSYEKIFKSVLQHLMDSATNEYVFVRQFFRGRDGPNNVWPRIFQRTTNLLSEHFENWLFNAHDCVGILLMIKIVHANRRVMKSRNVDSLDEFWDRLTLMLWPRLKVVVDAQIRSLKTADARRLGGVDTHPHHVSRRYAEFVCSVHSVLNRGRDKKKERERTRAAKSTRSSSSNNNNNNNNHKSSSSSSQASVSSDRPTSSSRSVSTTNTLHTKTLAPNQNNNNNNNNNRTAGDMLLRDLSVLSAEFVAMLERLSADVGGNDERRSTVFVINNVDAVLQVFAERKMTGREETTRFRELLARRRETFVEEELTRDFSRMIAFVTQTEAHLHGILSSSGGGDGLGGGSGEGRLEVNAHVVESLVRDFAATWKVGIERINRDVLSYFSNFRNGMEILKQVLTQLLLYYTRFQDIIRKVWRNKPPSFCKDLVSTTAILADIKKYALAI